jgi:crotonobetainyl-CoA:carnitine CoA-transferase CaiB-like acyl-CoA transferase
LQEFLAPFYRNFVCADGRPFYNCCPSHKTHAVEALKTLGLWEEMAAASAPLVDPYLPTREWPEGVDCTLRAYPLSKEWADYISERLEEVLRRKTSFEWERIYGEKRLPGAAQRTTKEWLGSEHAFASGLVVEVNDAVYGRMRQPGNAVWIQEYPVDLEKRPAAELDADREDILCSLPEERTTPGIGDAEVDGGPPLEGVKVLDLTNVIAGPTISTTLSRFGAEVIKVDPTVPTLDPWNTIVFGLQANRGKSSALVDLGTPDGQNVLNRLLGQVDVVVFNGLERQLDRLGLHPELLKKSHPGLILCRFDTYGGPRPGPRSETPGYDDTVQASTGVMARFGGSLTTPEEHAHFGTIDVLGGFCGAFSIALALLDRFCGGEARVARSSLAAAGQLIQLPFMYDYEGREPLDEPSGRELKGEHPLYRLYEAEDGWFFLAARPQTQDRLAGIPELSDIDATAAEDLEEYLEERLRLRPASYWTGKL